MEMAKCKILSTNGLANGLNEMLICINKWENMIMKKLIKDLSNLKDAFRVLEIMDRCGCDIEKENSGGLDKCDYWIIKPKWYVSEKDAKDLKTIILFKEHYSKESKLFRWLFYRRFRAGSRDFYE